MRDSKHTVSVTVTNEHVVVRRSGNSTPAVAKMLGHEKDSTGQIQTIWLDRIVHRSYESKFADDDATWVVSGAISSILKRENQSAV
jgi:hypothetical protein